jgi:hypothetical protein
MLCVHDYYYKLIVYRQQRQEISTDIHIYIRTGPIAPIRARHTSIRQHSPQTREKPSTIARVVLSTNCVALPLFPVSLHLLSRNLFLNYRHFEKTKRGNQNILTTSMICCKVRPNLTSRGSDSLATGLSKTLYGPNKVFSSRFSCGPCCEPAII